MFEIKDKVSLYWLGHASFKLDADGKLIYFDPWKVKKDKANLILITHSHFDHLSLEDVRKIQTKETTIVATKDSASKLSGDLRIVSAGDKVEIEGVAIEAVPSYNVGKNYHPKTSGWVGYVVTVDGMRIYHAGDTDAIGEMKKLKVDIALLPVGGTYTMTADEAAGMANEFKPKISIPMHWGSIVGSEADAHRFRDLFQGKTVILKPED
ncbi:MAG: MBL fold metallo-hydrolase [Thermodesulfobacteriota bacterium]